MSQQLEQSALCGIVGIVSLSGKPVDPDRARRASALLEARGPDYAGTWHEAEVALAHRRLSIIDLSRAGHQPMASADERYIIVYNGELYNFVELRRQLVPPPGGWRSNSDTEVLLAAYARWGKDCVAHFQGMFAFAIWDRQKHKLFAARDRMGVKPFYYSQTGGEFAFASRPRALWVACPETTQHIDQQALRWYLELGYIPAPHSIHQDIRKLPAGHHLTLSGGSVEVERYWDFRGIAPEPSWLHRREDDLLDELEALLSDIVRGRMLGDVPVGAFLSGGIDSSSVVALMAKHSTRPVRTFTIGFEEEGFDESAHAADVARHLGTDHVAEIVTPDNLVGLLPTFAREYDEPFFDSSAFPLMAVARLARQHVTVALTGDGADELFGGYHYYDIARWLGVFYQLPAPLRQLGAGAVSLFPQRRLQLLARAMQQRDTASGFAFSRSISKETLPMLAQDLSANTVSAEVLFRGVSAVFPPGLGARTEAMRIDALLTLADDYLQKVDVGSMAFSLEARDPFLDHRLVEWATRLPEEWKFRQGKRKYLLRKLAYRHVPQKLLDRPKMGFSVPIARWLRGPLRAWAEERIEDRTLFADGLLDQTVTRKLFHLHLSETRDLHTILWAILMFLEFKTNMAWVTEDVGSTSRVC